MPHVFDFTIDASLEESDLIHRIGHFKEDVYRECRDSDATFSDISALSRTLQPFSVTVHSKRGLGPFNKHGRGHWSSTMSAMLSTFRSAERDDTHI